MNHKLLLSFLIVLIALSPQFAVQAESNENIYFQDTSYGLLLLGSNSGYEIAFRKTNGSIAYILDKNTGGKVTQGSRYECLWGISYNQFTEFIGGCGYGLYSNDRFSYHWDQEENVLELSFQTSENSSTNVYVKVSIFAFENYFDLHLIATNNSNFIFESISFPGDLVFLSSDIEEALYPFLPGVVFNSEFFSNKREVQSSYPGGLFADFVSISSKKGKLSIYTVNPTDVIHPVSIGFFPDDGYLRNSHFLLHGFEVGLRPGEEWNSPTIRFKLGQSHMENLMDYRSDNEIDKYPGIKEKLGEVYSKTIKSPVIMFVSFRLGLPLSRIPDYFHDVAKPAILHPIGYHPGGHDENSPDYLPPDIQWGTTDDFMDMTQELQSIGFLIMPYINPTFWQADSPTMKQLLQKTTMSEIAALDQNGEPYIEYYFSGVEDKDGFVVSPYSPYVQDRVDSLMEEISEELSIDLLFEDQIGARGGLFDYNVYAPNLWSFPTAWLEHAKTHTDKLIMNEMGYDRLAKYGVGFYGSVLWTEKAGGTEAWGEDGWYVFPMAGMVFRDKVLFYQHNLYHQTFTSNKETFSWNLAFGYNTNVEFESREWINNPWVKNIFAFQQDILSKYIDERILDFKYIEDKVSQTDFETFTVIKNWDRENFYLYEDYEIPEHGVISIKNDKSIIGGVFTKYNGKTLGFGEHYIIEIRKQNEIIIKHPMGINTFLSINLLPNWNEKTRIKVDAVTKNGQVFENIPYILEDGQITFMYKNVFPPNIISYYRIKGESNDMRIAY